MSVENPKTVIVTGAASGIGFACVQGLVAAHSTLTWRELTTEHFDHILTVNVTGSFLMARAAAEHMAGGGAIVLTSSGSINVGGVGGHGRGGPAYVSSKA